MTAQEILKEKSAEFNRLTADLESLKNAEVSAKGQLQEAQEGIQEFDSLPSKIAKWRADQLKGGRDPRKLPDGIQKAQAAKQQASEELELAEGTLKEITDSLAWTKQRLFDLQKGELKEAAARVLESHAESIAEELIPLKLRVEELEQMLYALRRITYVNRVGLPINAGDTAKINRALHSGYEYPPNSDPTGRMSRQWEAKLAAVMLDPATPLDDLRPVMPSDYQG